MTPAPSPHDLDALAPLVESAYSDGVPESAFVAYTTIGEVWVVPLSEYAAVEQKARSRELWEKRAKAAQTIAAGFGLVLAIIAFAQTFRILEGLWK